MSCTLVLGGELLNEEREGEREPAWENPSGGIAGWLCRLICTFIPLTTQFFPYSSSIYQLYLLNPQIIHIHIYSAWFEILTNLVDDNFSISYGYDDNIPWKIEILWFTDKTILQVDKYGICQIPQLSKLILT